MPPPCACEAAEFRNGPNMPRPACVDCGGDSGCGNGAAFVVASGPRCPACRAAADRPTEVLHTEAGGPNVITIRSLDLKGSTVTLEVDGSMLIIRVKARILEDLLPDNSPYRPGVLRLVFRGRELKNGATLRDCGVAGGDVVFLVFPTQNQ